jgi:cytochrome c biogenesis protein CcmG, thiol:disulfide interchange protein DsbE
MTSKAAAIKRRRQQVAARKARTSTYLFIGVAVTIVALFVISIALTRNSTDSTESTGLSEVQNVTVTGDALPALPETGADPAVGLPAAELAGRSFDGQPVSIANDGRSKVVLFLAHWCPHCQNEVPVLQDWVDQGGLPKKTDLYTVSTGVDKTLPNYPPSAWLEREHWTSPVLVDDAAESAAAAFGMTGTPYWVFVDSDGLVAARTAGELAMDDLDAILSRLNKR